MKKNISNIAGNLEELASLDLSIYASLVKLVQARRIPRS